MRRFVAFASFVLTILAIAPVGAVEPADIVWIEDTDHTIDSKFMTGSQYLMAAGKRFYAQTKTDAYDGLVFFRSTGACGLLASPEGWPVKQDQEGIGRPTSNASAKYGSKGRLRQALKMGNIDCFADDTEVPHPGIPGYSLTGVELIAHEFGHHTLASAKYDTGDGTGPRCWLRSTSGSGSFDGACDSEAGAAATNHWSAWFNQGSVMYASVLEDLGHGSFRATNPGLKYGPLDQYLMGLRAPEEVGPMFLVERIWGADSDNVPPLRGQSRTFKGARIDFTIDDVIRALGPRVPSRDACHWKIGLAMVHPPGGPPTEKQLERMAKYMTRWEEFHAWATDGRGSLDATLDGRGTGTEGCPATAAPGPDDPLADEGTPEAVEGASEEVAVPEDVEAAEEVKVPEEVQGPAEVPAQVDVYVPDSGDSGGEDAVQDASLADPGASEVETGGTCEPRTRRCDGNVIRQCTPDGATWQALQDCATSGMACIDDGVCAASDAKGGGCTAGPAQAPFPAGLAALLAIGAIASVAARGGSRRRTGRA